MKQLSCSQVAEMVNGELIGQTDCLISAVASLEDATTTELSFLGNDKYAPQVKESAAGIVLIPENYQIEDDKCYIKCKNASAAFSSIIDFLLRNWYNLKQEFIHLLLSPKMYNLETISILDLMP